MTLKAFPFLLRIGTDIVHIPRIRHLITTREGRYIQRFAKRILHSSEQQDCEKRFPGFLYQGSRLRDEHLSALSRWLAGRFAAKEAARKALGASTLSWKEARVHIAADGSPELIYSINRRIEADEEQQARLSIAHDGDYAMATVLAVPVT